LNLGGTILNTSKSPELKKDEAIKKAAETLALNNVDGLIRLKIFVLLPLRRVMQWTCA
jgi:6-phosphofructokinase